MLRKYLSAKKQEIRNEICSTADYKGDSCWLWMPKKTPNPHVCLVAHIDTVFDHSWSEPAKKIFHDPAKSVYWSPQGLGADDRSGVHACLLLRKMTGCMVLLTDYEECGGLGAKEASEIFPKHFGDTAFFLEIDRKGNGEMVFYNGESPEFKTFIGGFGFKEQNGVFSDITILSRELNIVGVNVSAGYYNQHTQMEYCNENHLNSTITKVLNIIKKGGKDYDKAKWQIANPVCFELSGDYCAGDVLLHNNRRGKGTKVARRWEF